MKSNFYFDGYTELEEISSGANATVYKAKHVLLNRHVAIKIYNKKRPNEKRDKIVQGWLESQKTAQATIPQVINVYDAGIKENKYYTILEYFESKTLLLWLTETRPSMASRAHLCRHILIQIFTLSEAGLFHGDFHEENVLVGRPNLPENLWWVRGKSQCPDYRIIDFGTSEFSGKLFSVARHWRVFHKTYKSILHPFDIDLLHQNPKPPSEKPIELFEWYHSFVASIPWFLARLGRLHPLGYGRSPFPIRNTEQLSELLSSNHEFQSANYMGDDDEWGTFDYIRYQSVLSRT